MERVTGIEHALSAWEAEVLPLNYTRVAGVGAARAWTSYRKVGCGVAGVRVG